jgi:hypothetical protein
MNELQYDVPGAYAGSHVDPHVVVGLFMQQPLTGSVYALRLHTTFFEFDRALLLANESYTQLTPSVAWQLAVA